MDAIRLSHVNKSYGEKQVLVDFSLSVPKGEFLTVIGRSGCGKTTFLKLLNGLIVPDEGEIFIEGDNINELDLIKLRRKMGYCLQNRGLFPHMTVEKNISYVPVISGKKDKQKNHELVLSLLSLVGLSPDMASRYPLELSGGQQQRVGIARAIAASPEILLMDEPFGSLDEITRVTMQDEIRRLHERLGMTIIFITHDIREAMKLGDRVLVIDEGKPVQIDTPGNIKEHPATPFVSELVGSNREL